MNAPEPEIRYATEADAPAILALMQQYYVEDGYPIVEKRSRKALDGLLGDRSLGRVWVMSADEEIVGYFAITLGFSLEYLGRDAFLDELYVVPAWRGKGLGRRALILAERECEKLEVNALHLEVESDKTDAYRLYVNAGFSRNERRLMTKRLDPPQS